MSAVKPEKVKFMLLATDMRRAVSFYKKVFGLDEIFVSEFWSELNFGNAIIAFHGGHDGTLNPTGLSFQFEDVLDAVERIEQSGGLILDLPAQREGEPILLGRYRDPEGNEGFITQYVG
jgi:predicted enzyme related to lactoylglutathione lyase